MGAVSGPSYAALVALALGAVRCGPPRVLVQDAGPEAAAPDAGDPLAWPACSPGSARCVGSVHQRCVGNGEFGRAMSEDCAPSERVCVAERGCVACVPGAVRCAEDEQSVGRWAGDGSAWESAEMCDVPAGFACVASTCQRLCTNPRVLGTNIGCEYYAVDLDNAQLGAGESAASQQYAVVLSNPHRTLSALLVVTARPDVQVARTMARDGLDAASAGARIDAQLPMASKVAEADWVVDNSGERERLDARVAELYATIVLREGPPVEGPLAGALAVPAGAA